jgi:hypothetical protein
MQLTSELGLSGGLGLTFRQTPEVLSQEIEKGKKKSGNNG